MVLVMPRFLGHFGLPMAWHFLQSYFLGHQLTLEKESWPCLSELPQNIPAVRQGWWPGMHRADKQGAV